MNIEVRMKLLSEAYEFMNQDIDIIALGDENCVYKLPGYDEIKKLSEVAKQNNKKIRIVFPKTPSSHFEQVCQLLEQVVKLDLLLTLNDYGLIFKAKDLECPNGFAVGRNIAFSLFSSPWYDLLVKNEDEKMRLSLATSNMESKYKLEYLKEMGANEIEMEYLEEVCKSTDIMRELGFKITAHYDVCLVAYGRCCSVMKHKKQSTALCKEHHGCKDPYLIDIYEKFVSIPVQDKDQEYKGSTHFVKDKEVEQLFPTLLVYGNGLYRKNIKNQFKSENVSTCIINLDFYKDNLEIKDTTRKIRSLS